MRQRKSLLIILILALATIVSISLSRLTKRQLVKESPSPSPTRVPTDLSQASDIQGEGFKVLDELHLGAVDQRAGREVTISAVIPPGGYVVIHEETKDGKPGQIIGVSDYLTPGEHDSIKVTTERELVEGEKIIVMLHVDDGDKAFSANKDVPIVDPSGSIALLHILVSPEEGAN